MYMFVFYVYMDCSYVEEDEGFGAFSDYLETALRDPLLFGDYRSALNAEVPRIYDAEVPKIYDARL